MLKSSRLQRRWNLRNTRKHTQTSIIISILLGGVIFISSCSGKKWNYDFQTSEEALSLYRQELKAVREMPSCTTDEFITALQDWQEMSDTVFAYIEKDPAFTAHTSLSMDFMALSDSIRTEFYRIATKGNYSLADIAKIRLATSSFDASQQMVDVQQEALKFYAKADSVSLDKNIKGERLLSLYRSYLTRVKRSGIHSEPEMLAFILQEDKLFRGYLAELPLFIQSNLTDITQLTDEICQGIYSAANKGRIGKESVLVYMGVRTNRRLLQNACTSERIIASGKARNAPQANAYLWMALQPFIAIDTFCLTLMTDAQKEEYRALAKAVPALTKQLRARKLLNEDYFDNITNQILRIHLSIL